MSGKPLERSAKLVAAVVALTAAAMALYVQLFEVRARQEESRLAALRLDDALGESRSRLKAEILAELRADGARGGSEPAANQPTPGSVLRKPESGKSASGARSPGLEPSLPTPPLTLSGLAQGLESLAQQTQEADRALRRDLEEFRAATRSELDAAAKVRILTLIALLPLVAYLLLSYWLQPDRSDLREGP